MSGKSKAKIVIFIIILLLLSVGVLFFLGQYGIEIPFLKTDKTSKFKQALEENNYQAAYWIYVNSQSQETEKQELTEHVNKYIDICTSEQYSDETWKSYRAIEIFKSDVEQTVFDGMDRIVTNFYTGAYSMEEAREYIKRVGKFDFATEKKNYCTGQIELKEESDKAYDEGVKLFNSGEYEKAMEEFKKVSERDEARMSNVIYAKEQCKAVYGAQKLKEAREMYDAGDRAGATKLLNDLIEMFGEYSEAQAMLDEFASNTAAD